MTSRLEIIYSFPSPSKIEFFTESTGAGSSKSRMYAKCNFNTDNENSDSTARKILLVSSKKNWEQDRFEIVPSFPYPDALVNMAIDIIGNNTNKVAADLNNKLVIVKCLKDEMGLLHNPLTF
jgi:hypothetical protein